MSQSQAAPDLSGQSQASQASDQDLAANTPEKVHDRLCQAGESAVSLFAVIDTDHTGKVTREDLQQFTDKIMSADKSNKGYVTTDDVIAAANSSARHRMLWKLDNKYDKDIDGSVSISELGPDANKYRALDVNHDGVIDAADFQVIGQQACLATSSSPRTAAINRPTAASGAFILVPVAGAGGGAGWRWGRRRWRHGWRFGRRISRRRRRRRRRNRRRCHGRHDGRHRRRRDYRRHHKRRKRRDQPGCHGRRDNHPGQPGRSHDPRRVTTTPGTVTATPGIVTGTPGTVTGAPGVGGQVVTPGAEGVETPAAAGPGGAAAPQPAAARQLRYPEQYKRDPRRHDSGIHHSRHRGPRHDDPVDLYPRRYSKRNYHAYDHAGHDDAYRRHIRHYHADDRHPRRDHFDYYHTGHDDATGGFPRRRGSVLHASGHDQSVSGRQDSAGRAPENLCAVGAPLRPQALFS